MGIEYRWLIDSKVIKYKQMDFKSNKRKDHRGTLFDDAPKSYLLDEDNSWEHLRDAVETSSKEKKHFGKFSKNSSAFDDSLKPDREKVEVNIKLSLPKIKSPTLEKSKSKLKEVSTRLAFGKSKKFIGVTSLVSLFLLAGVGFTLKHYVLDKNPGPVLGDNSTTGGTVAGGATKPSDLPREKPTYKILYPGTKDEQSVGEIVRISPPNTPAVYTYIDKIGDVTLNVSQQELPDRFKTNQDGELQKLATDFQQKDVIQVDSVKVYHGITSSGIQSLLFIKGNLLLTIRASQKVSDDTWAAYVSALHS